MNKYFELKFLKAVFSNDFFFFKKKEGKTILGKKGGVVMLCSSKQRLSLDWKCRSILLEQHDQTISIWGKDLKKQKSIQVITK